MRKFLKYTAIILSILIAGGIGVYIYWQSNKKKLIKDTISNTLKKNTDSLYIINYDSSAVDEINGNASFYNITLRPDSARKETLRQLDSLPNALYNITVRKISATGVDVAGLIKKENLAARKILLDKPFIQITNTGLNKPKPFTYKDTLELYKHILGRFKSIHADTIQIINGTVIMANSKGKSLTTFENINIGLKNFLVDSTKNYKNILSYFIKDVKVTVENIQLPESKNDTRINIVKLDYDAAKKMLSIAEIQQYKTNTTNPLTDLKNIQINELNTDAFIVNRELKAGIISCDGGIVTIYKNNKPNKKKTIEFSSNTIDEAEIGGINLGNTKVSIINPQKPSDRPIVITDVKFSVSKVASVADGRTVSEIINTANWQLSAREFSIITKDKLYKVTVNGISVDNQKSLVKVGHVYIKPLLSEAAFVRSRKHQEDMYDLSFNNIILQNIDLKKLYNNKIIEIQSASLQPVMKIFNDRTLPPDPNSKVGKYPHQLLLKMSLPIYVNKVQVRNGSISYRERAAKSQLIGNTFFTNVNGTLTNVTNIPKRIQDNSLCTVNANALFLGKGKLSTIWKLSLNAANKNFNVSGNLNSMDAMALNPIIEPLAMASVKSGRINRLDFNLFGNDYKGTGEVVFLYNDLNIEILKKGEGKELVPKEVVSFFANTLIKHDNPRKNKKNELYKSQANYDRDIHKSFFNLLWKSIFDGVKKTALGKKAGLKNPL